MVVRIVGRKDQLIKENYNGAVRERKVLGFPQEQSPMKPYSNIFYWSHLSSDFGCVITEHPLIGFEILTYVIKGSYETYDKSTDKWEKLNVGDLGIIQAGKGIRQAEKILPRSEVLQIWFDPNFDEYRKISPVMSHYTSNLFPEDGDDFEVVKTLKGKNAPIRLNAQEVSIHMLNLKPGIHHLENHEDFILSGYVLNGYLDLQGKTLSMYDFFSTDKNEISLNSLSESQVFLITSPLKPEYQTYAEMHL